MIGGEREKPIRPFPRLDFGGNIHVLVLQQRRISCLCPREVGMAQGRWERGTHSPWHCTHRRSAPGLYEPIVEGERLHNGGVGLGALLKLL